jgi:acyl-CoA thioesterase II
MAGKINHFAENLSNEVLEAFERLAKGDFTFQAKGFQAASLDHTIWLHQPIKVDEWLYYQMDSTRAANATGLCRGSIYTRDGVLVASTAQEGLMRARKNKQ